MQLITLILYVNLIGNKRFILMKATNLFLVFILILLNGYSQNTVLTINNNAYITISNGAVLTIENGHADAIQVMGAGGNIVSEGELNKLSWSIGTNTGVYAVPFSNSAGEKIPLIVDISIAGTGSGRIDFSTYGGSDWDNDNFKPSDVSHMLDIETGSVNNSAYVIDRFWIIETSDYSTSPTSSMSFTYLESEISAAGNTIDESKLKAQRFNSIGGSWGDMLPIGVVDINTNTVNDITVSPENFFRSWTLVDYSHPLPVELVSFDVSCQSYGRLISWQTATESNNNYFTIEKSYDTQHFSFFKRVNGSGNSASLINYSVTDEESYNGTVYYRILQTDYDGKFKIISLKSSNCQTDNFNDFNAWAFQDDDGLVVNVTIPKGENVQLNLYDGIGKLIYNSQLLLNDGTNRFVIPVNQLSTSIYLLKMKTLSGKEISLKNFIKKDF